MKGLITLCVLIFSTIGGWLGAEMDHGNWFGLSSFILSTIGCFVGIWAAVWLNKRYIG